MLTRKIGDWSGTIATRCERLEEIVTGLILWPERSCWTVWLTRCSKGSSIVNHLVRQFPLGWSQRKVHTTEQPLKEIREFDRMGVTQGKIRRCGH
jgi:hypothetical protein